MSEKFDPATSSAPQQHQQQFMNHQGAPPPNVPPPGYHYNAPPNGSGPGQKYEGPIVIQQPQMLYPATGYYQPMTIVTQQAPPDYLGYAIFVTICCFWPLGIVAILRASESRSAASCGDIGTAVRRSQEAKRLSHITLAIGIICVAIIIILMLVYLIVLKQVFYHY